MLRRSSLLLVPFLGLSFVSIQSSAKSHRENRLENTFLLRHRISGDVSSFYKTSHKELAKVTKRAGLNSLKIQDCRQRDPAAISVEQVKLTPEQKKEVQESEKTVSQRLELAILLEAFTTRQQTDLTDSQRDWVQDLNTCDSKIRNGLRALALMLSDYELLKAAEI